MREDERQERERMSATAIDILRQERDHHRRMYPILVGLEEMAHAQFRALVEKMITERTCAECWEAAIEKPKCKEEGM